MNLLSRDEFINFVLTHPDMEGGGKVWRDPIGGLTKYGISAKTYPGIDIANLSLESATMFAVRDYWVPCHCDDMAPVIARLVFDFAYHSGQQRAIRSLQASLRIFSDGVMGDETLNAVRAVGDTIVCDYLARRAVYLTGMDNFDSNGRGYMKRLFTLMYYILGGLEK